jgi:hypothetical protein
MKRGLAGVFEKSLGEPFFGGAGRRFRPWDCSDQRGVSTAKSDEISGSQPVRDGDKFGAAAWETRTRGVNANIGAARWKWRCRSSQVVEWVNLPPVLASQAEITTYICFSVMLSHTTLAPAPLGRRAVLDCFREPYDAICACVRGAVFTVLC